MANKKTTAASIASLAAPDLQDSYASATAKNLSDSAFFKVNKGIESGRDMEGLASAVVSSEKYSDTSKTSAGPILTQADKNR